MASISFTVHGKTVSKSNSYIAIIRGKFARIVKANKVKKYEELVAEAAREAVVRTGWELSDKELKVKVLVTWGDRRRRDVLNVNKSIFDALNGIIYKDDCQIVYAITEKNPVKKGIWKVRITITEVL